MANERSDLDKHPTPDPAEHNAFFPSPYSLSQYTSPKSNLSGADYPNAYRDGKWKVLMIAADERYLLTQNDSFFSTGNHPIETLLPVYHMVKAGFDFDIATVSGNPMKMELWAFPKEDKEIQSIYERFLPQIRTPLKLSDVIANNLGNRSKYIALFIPGGHGALVGLPRSPEVKQVLEWTMTNDRYLITLCHGPAALLAAAIGETRGKYLFEGYKICAFPDAVDRKLPDVGYLPGALRWSFGEELRKLGVEIVNDEMTGKIHQDRKVISGDSPLAANSLGKAAAQALLNEVSRAAPAAAA